MNEEVVELRRALEDFFNNVTEEADDDLESRISYIGRKLKEITDAEDKTGFRMYNASVKIVYAVEVE